MVDAPGSPAASPSRRAMSVSIWLVDPTRFGEPTFPSRSTRSINASTARRSPPRIGRCGGSRRRQVRTTADTRRSACRPRIRACSASSAALTSAIAPRVRPSIVLPAMVQIPRWTRYTTIWTLGMVGDARLAGTSRDRSGHLSGAYRALLDPNLIHSSHALRCALSGCRASSERGLPELDRHLRSSPHMLGRTRRAVTRTLHEVDTHSPRTRTRRWRGSERARIVSERLVCAHAGASVTATSTSRTPVARPSTSTCGGWTCWAWNWRPCPARRG